MKKKNCCGSSATCGNDFCGGCEGTEILTPLPTANRPGLSALSYRIGTHASFLETMKARLASKDYPELAGLTARDSSDPSIALLDAWAAVADVLTFYQERIANEGYLRTATERRSVLELGRLVGYKMRPGVSSSVFLAYTLDQHTEGEVVIPAGSRAQSIPGPGELPQTFESSEDLKARSGWNNLRPRMTQPQTKETIQAKKQIYLKGINTNLKPNDPLLIGFGDGKKPELHWVKEVNPDAKADRTLVELIPEESGEGGSNDGNKEVRPVRELISDLMMHPSLQPVNRLRMRRDLKKQLVENTDTSYRILTSTVSKLHTTLTTTIANSDVATSNNIRIFTLRTKVSLFGHNASRKPKYKIPEMRTPKIIAALTAGQLEPQSEWDEWEPWKTDEPDGESKNILYLERGYDNILQDNYIALVGESGDAKLFEIDKIYLLSKSAYNINGESTKIELKDNWWNPEKVEERGVVVLAVREAEVLAASREESLAEEGSKEEKKDTDIHKIRTTKAYIQQEELKLAEEPIDTPVGKQEDEKVDDRIELDGFYDGLESGRWVIVSGEREIEGTNGVQASELAMLSSVTQDVATVPAEATDNGTNNSSNKKAEATTRPEEKIHTFIKLAEPLAYSFKRDTVKIYGNVVKATCGETRREVLGSGEGSKTLQTFTLKQKPVTHVAASNPTGTDNTLKVFVNDIRWHEAETLADREPPDRNFITKTDDENNTSIVFGNGEKGARLPTGIENIKAEYRSGIGKTGNVKAGQVSLLMDRPLGLKEVINPLRASGGADRESRDQARKNVPLAVRALDRLVSVQDYEDFARVYAGIGKAKAAELTDGRRQLVHVTIAETDDIPIDETSDLFQNLFQSLHEFGDPYQPIRLAVRELMLMVVSANVRILPDYQWEPVVTKLRETMLEAFSFERRELGQDVLLSEVFSVMQSVRGVDYVDIDFFGGIPEKIKGNNEGDARRLLTPKEISDTIDRLSKQWTKDNRLLTSDEVAEAIWCELQQQTRADKYSKYQGNDIGKATMARQRLEVNIADFENGSIRPAQLAFLTPGVPETLILNQIK